MLTRQLQVIETAQAYDALYHQWQGQCIALVPTMGALHEGHASLIRQAREQADYVVVSIFVNPLQFGVNEDLSLYPRPLEADFALCESLDVDAVFHPTVETMYPEGMENVTKVIPPAYLTERLCGTYRPGHFTGVATIVLKLFNLIRPSQAFFGEKDAQQLAVIRKMVQDLQVPVEIIGCPTVRNEQGLALSSRNTYLQGDIEHQAALCLSQMLRQIATEVLETGGQPAKPALEHISAAVMEAFHQRVDSKDVLKLQYLEAVDGVTFQPVDTLKPGVKLLIAAYVNQVRLIDNLDIAI